MFNRITIESKVDREIIASLEKLETQRDNPEKYAATLENATKLNKLKTPLEPRRGLHMPSLDTVLIVGANIFGILWLAQYEKENVIKSQSAFRMMLKPK